jgi:sec1 family domain-containing protein 1
LSGVKNLLPSRKELIISKVVSNIISPTNEVSEVDDYLQFDPKLSKNAKPSRHKVAYQEAIVFVIGGGNYIEYQNLQEVASVSSCELHSATVVPENVILIIIIFCFQFCLALA